MMTNAIDITTNSVPFVSKRDMSFGDADPQNLPPPLPSTSSSSSQLRIQLLSSNATLPTKGSIHSAGWDLCSAVDMVIPKQSRALIPLDLSMACPPNTYARIAPRSGLALKHGIHVGAGVVDADYRGPVSVLLFNMGEKDFEVLRGDRIAQCILEYICMADIVQVESLEETERGSGGFGSTGVSATIPAAGAVSSSDAMPFLKKTKITVDEASMTDVTASVSSDSSSEEDDISDEKKSE